MATSAKCGTSGSVSLGGEITAWEFNELQDIPEATSMLSAGSREFIGCLKSGEGTFDSLIAAGAIGYQDSVEFINEIETIHANIIVTDINLVDDVSDNNKFRYSYVTTGPVVIS